MDFQNWAASLSQTNPDQKRLELELGPGGDRDKPYIFLPLTTLKPEGIRALIKTLRRYLSGEVGGKDDGSRPVGAGEEGSTEAA